MLFTRGVGADPGRTGGAGGAGGMGEAGGRESVGQGGPHVQAGG
jgi:hypothetical protein